MTDLEQALIAAVRAFLAHFDDAPEQSHSASATPQQEQQPATSPQTQATQQTALTLEALSTELRNLETQTQGRLFSQISPLLIKYVGAIPGPGGSQMPAGGVQQLPPTAYAPFLQEAQALAAQLMQGSTAQ